jgi:hypothetical protein
VSGVAHGMNANSTIKHSFGNNKVIHFGTISLLVKILQSRYYISKSSISLFWSLYTDLCFLLFE